MPTNKKEYNDRYHKEKLKKVNIFLNKSTDAELIEVYESIPNKRQWFLDCLREYAKRNK